MFLTDINDLNINKNNFKLLFFLFIRYVYDRL